MYLCLCTVAFSILWTSAAKIEWIKICIKQNWLDKVSVAVGELKKVCEPGLATNLGDLLSNMVRSVDQLAGRSDFTRR